MGPSHSSQPYELAFTSAPAHSTTPLTAEHLHTGPPDQRTRELSHKAIITGPRHLPAQQQFTLNDTRDAGKAPHIGNMF